MLTAAPGTPELMPLERALEITQAINDRTLFEMELVPAVASLEGVTLCEMLDALDRVELENAVTEKAARAPGEMRTFYVVPAARLIAAAYVLENYENDDNAIVAMPCEDEWGRSCRKWLGIGRFAL